MKKPLIVALCGIPKAGKSTVQEILKEEYDIAPFDDGGVIRSHCQELFGLTRDDTHTQEGKERYTTVGDTRIQNRVILGDYGDALEKMFGEFTIPNWAIRTALKDHRQTHSSNIGYSFGSVRRNQGKAYLNAGGVVVEVVNPRAEPTDNIWDLYEKGNITHTLDNSGTLDELYENTVKLFDEIINGG